MKRRCVYRRYLRRALRRSNVGGRMSIPPDAVKSITNRINAKNRANCLARAHELSAEGKKLRDEAKDLTARLGLYCGKISSFILEMRAEQAKDDTEKLPILPGR